MRCEVKQQETGVASLVVDAASGLSLGLQVVSFWGATAIAIWLETLQIIDSASSTSRRWLCMGANFDLVTLRIKKISINKHYFEIFGIWVSKVAAKSPSGHDRASATGLSQLDDLVARQRGSGFFICHLDIAHPVFYPRAKTGKDAIPATRKCLVCRRPNFDFHEFPYGNLLLEDMEDPIFPAFAKVKSQHARRRSMSLEDDDEISPKEGLPPSGKLT